ncbi:hypothetical protein [Xanthomonas arboricola]|nr:hypothetical protein [Xanthomonas arboricola]
MGTMPGCVNQQRGDGAAHAVTGPCIAGGAFAAWLNPKARK